MDVAKQEASLPITKMHAVSLTIAEKIAIMALARPHPLTIAIGLKTVFPHIHEIILKQRWNHRPRQNLLSRLPGK